MKKSEHAAALKAAQEELARLQAITPEDDVPLMVLPACKHAANFANYFWLCGDMQAIPAHDTGGEPDSRLWNCGNYMESAEQAEGYGIAFSTMMLMRRQPGVVANLKIASTADWRYLITVDGSEVRVGQVSGTYHSHCMFPQFASHKEAQAAIKAVGEKAIVHTARFLSGAITK